MDVTTAPRAAQAQLTVSDVRLPHLDEVLAQLDRLERLADELDARLDARPGTDASAAVRA